MCVYPVLLCCCLGASPDSSPPRTGAAAWRAGGELGQDKCVFLPVPRCHVAGSYKLTESTVRFAFENVVRGMGTTVHSREGGSPGRAFDLAELREEPASKFSNMQHLVRILHEFYLAYHTGSEACACQQEQRDSMAQQGTRQVQVCALCSTPFST